MNDRRPTRPRPTRTTGSGVVLALVPAAPPAGGHAQDRPLRDALRVLTASTRLGALAAWRALFRARRPVRPAGRLPERVRQLLAAGVPAAVAAEVLAREVRATVYAEARRLGLLTPPALGARVDRRRAA